MSKKKARKFAAFIVGHHEHSDVAANYAGALAEQEPHWSEKSTEMLSKHGLTPDDMDDYLRYNGVDADDVEHTDYLGGPHSSYVFASLPVGEFYESRPDDDELENVGITRAQYEKAMDKAGYHVMSDGSVVMATDRVYYLELTVDMCEACAKWKQR